MRSQLSGYGLLPLAKLWSDAEPCEVGKLALSAPDRQDVWLSQPAGSEGLESVHYLG